MMKYQLVIFILTVGVGCLDDNVPPRPSPADQGVEDNFDARQPPVAPNTGSGYGSGYSGSAPPQLNTDQSLDIEIDDMSVSDDDMSVSDTEVQVPVDFGLGENDS